MASEININNLVQLVREGGTKQYAKLQIDFEETSKHLMELHTQIKTLRAVARSAGIELPPPDTRIRFQEGRMPCNAKISRALAPKLSAEWEDRIVDYVKAHGPVKSRDVIAGVGMPASSTWSIIQPIVEKGRIVRVGKGSGAKYVTPDHPSLGKLEN